MSFAADFSNAMISINAEFEEEVEDTHVDHTVALMKELHARTPIGKVQGGRLVSAWRTSLNTPSDYVATRQNMRIESPSETRANLEGIDVGDEIWIVNNQPYGPRIEYGWGKKNPPTGFVRPALKTYTRHLKRS
jgi:hypothetical protein